MKQDDLLRKIDELEYDIKSLQEDVDSLKRETGLYVKRDPFEPFNYPYVRFSVNKIIYKILDHLNLGLTFVPGHDDDFELVEKE